MSRVGEDRGLAGPSGRAWNYTAFAVVGYFQGSFSDEQVAVRSRIVVQWAWWREQRARVGR